MICSFHMFQFHYGTIKSITYIIKIAAFRRFNSTMVRLKAARKFAVLCFYFVSIPLWYD